MDVPTIEELTSAFGAEPVSVAEIAFGQFLPLDEWPNGEVRARCEVSGRVATVFLSPSEESVTIELSVPDEFAKVTMPHTQKVAVRSGGQIVELVIEPRRSEGVVVRLRLQPDIRLSVALGGQ